MSSGMHIAITIRSIPIPIINAVLLLISIPNMLYEPEVSAFELIVKSHVFVAFFPLVSSNEISPLCVPSTKSSVG